MSPSELHLTIDGHLRLNARLCLEMLRRSYDNGFFTLEQRRAYDLAQAKVDEFNDEAEFPILSNPDKFKERDLQRTSSINAFLIAVAGEVQSAVSVLMAGKVEFNVQF
jgi:hypothetical protein